MNARDDDKAWLDDDRLPVPDYHLEKVAQCSAAGGVWVPRICAEALAARRALGLYRISQDENVTYDTFDSAVVAAASEDDARRVHPDGSGATWAGSAWDDPERSAMDHLNAARTWAPPERVRVDRIGTAAPGIAAGAVLAASFNAG